MSETPDASLYHRVGWPFADEKVGHVAVAVSGGGDSMALLLLMQRRAQEHGAAISAVTVDHGLRPEAADEAAMVADLCTSRDIAHETLKWRGWDGKGNLQAEARDARYRLMAEWARARGVDAICLGHTREDQAETFLMRLARKAGSDGLRGMADRFERHGVRWVRPVLGIGRADLRAFLRRQGVGWIDDPSNEDAGFGRVKARQALEVLAPLGIDADTLAQVAGNLRAENNLIRDVTAAALAGRVEEQFGALSLDPGMLEDLHPELRRRFLNAVVRWMTGADYAPRAVAEASLTAALRAGKTHTLAGVIGWIGKGRIWLAREYRPVKEASGNPFDGRWRVDGPLGGREIRAIGESGLKQRLDWRDTGLPRRVFLPLPGVWEGDRLIHAPGIDAETCFKLSFLRTSFAKWLDEH